MAARHMGGGAGSFLLPFSPRGANSQVCEACLVLLFAAENGYAHSHLLEENLVDFFVPFLPLEYHHVKLCARDAFLARGLPYTEAALDEVASMMVFVPKEEKLFSAQGCKSVSQRINYFLP